MKLKLDNRASRKPVEHGDWRIPLDRPEEAEYLPPKDLPWLKKMHLRVQQQSAQFAAARGYLELYEDPTIIPIRGWSRALRILFSLFVLLPLSVVLVFSLLVQLYHVAPLMGNSSFWLSEPVWFSLLGVALYLSLVLMKCLEPILVYLYVLGHELTHALVALLCCGRISALRVGLGGGYVETDKDNVFIALAPYFVPLWMLLWMLLFALANWIFPFESFYPWFYAGSAFWWSFHICRTLWVIPREQPDMLENGMLFSALITLLMNIFVLLGLLVCFGGISPIGYLHDVADCASSILLLFQDVWSFLGAGLFHGAGV